jgi:ABC-type multidrug transport system fused ATPase/permease subunit
MNKIKRYLKKLPEIMREWIWLSQYIRKYWLGVLTYVLLGVTAVGMGLIVARATGQLINIVTKQADGSITRAIATVIGLSLARIAFNSMSSWLTARINIRVTNEIRHEIFEKIMLSRWESLRDYHSGEIINRLEGDVGSVASGVVSFIPSLITNLVQFIGAFVIIMMYDPTMALFALASAPVLVFSAKPLMKIMRKYTEQTRKINGEILSFNEEAFQNIQLVKAFDLTKQRCQALGTLLQEYRRVRLEYTRISILVSAAMSVIGLAAGYACYGWAVYRLYQGEFLYGDMTALLQITSMLSSAFSALVSLVPTAVSTATSAGRVIEVTTLPAEADADAEKALDIARRAGEGELCIQAEHVTFTYGDAPEPVLTDATFSARCGEIVAFVGPSGGGKTTILRLLLGLLQPVEGTLSVSLTGEEGLSSLPISDSTRRLCAYVPQGNSIFSGTIESNLRAVAPEATDQQLEAALRAADAWDFVSAQPAGIQTVLGERGVNLSEGQLQRLAIARAVLRDAPVLIMDEATSALDVETEARVLKNIMQSNPRRICLVTTHRASMLDYSSRVYDVSGGHLREVSATEALPAQQNTEAVAGV